MMQFLSDSIVSVLVAFAAFSMMDDVDFMSEVIELSYSARHLHGTTNPQYDTDHNS